MLLLKSNYEHLLSCIKPDITLCLLAFNIFFNRYEGKLLNTRQQIDFARTNVRAMSMRMVGVKLWNALDHSLKDSKTRYIFSKYYKENVLRSYYHNDHNTVMAL